MVPDVKPIGHLPKMKLNTRYAAVPTKTIATKHCRVWVMANITVKAEILPTPLVD